MSATLFDTSALFEAYAAGTTAAHDGVRVVPVKLRSRHQGVLVEEDRGIVENERFTAPLFVPERAVPHVAGAGEGLRELVVLFHGLNEGTEAKLFPWAASLAARGTAALVFPASFHLSRRPASFLAARGDAFASRRAVDGNERVSPYNATLSQRMATRPDRFLRGTLQTYRDVVDLARVLDRGDDALVRQGLDEDDASGVARWFARGARVSFLGYSIGGYLAQLAMLANEDGLFSDSRALLFSTGAALAQVRPQTILILDVHAQDQLVATYDNEESRDGRLALFDELGATASERRWLLSMLYATDELRAGQRALGGRMRAVANVNDLVFPIDAVRDALGDMARDELSLGLHELPFNQSAPLGETYTDREGRRLLLTVVRSHTVAPDLRDGFARFVDLAHGHLAR